MPFLIPFFLNFNRVPHLKSLWPARTAWRKSFFSDSSDNELWRSVVECEPIFLENYNLVFPPYDGYHQTSIYPHTELPPQWDGRTWLQNLRRISKRTEFKKPQLSSAVNPISVWTRFPLENKQFQNGVQFRIVSLTHVLHGSIYKQT